MRGVTSIPTVALVLAVMAVSVSTSASCAGSRTVLSWDDGECDETFSAPHNPDSVAVWFQAPEGARYVTGLWLFLVDSGPPGIGLGVNVLRPSGSWPYSPGPGVWSWPAPVSTFNDTLWTYVGLPVPVAIWDSGDFPDRVFFVEVAWPDLPPAEIGVDTDEPIDHKSFTRYAYEWVGFARGDIMVRAVVSDTTTAVSESSWGRLKAGYR